MCGCVCVEGADLSLFVVVWQGFHHEHGCGNIRPSWKAVRKGYYENSARCGPASLQVGRAPAAASPQLLRILVTAELIAPGHTAIFGQVHAMMNGRNVCTLVEAALHIMNPVRALRMRFDSVDTSWSCSRPSCCVPCTTLDCCGIRRCQSVLLHLGQSTGLRGRGGVSAALAQTGQPQPRFWCFVFFYNKPTTNYCSVLCACPAPCRY